MTQRPPDDRSGTVPDVAGDLATLLANAAAGSVEAVILYGSHLLGANPDRHSALDFVVVVDDYARFYRALNAAREIHRSPRVMVAFSRFLPPNVIAFTPQEGAGGIAKCLVTDRSDFVRALGPNPPDHFLLARMVQQVALVRAVDEERRSWAESVLEAARSGVLDWVGPFLAEPFDAEDLGRRLLEVCYRAEFRPEARNRADTIFEMQRTHFRDRFGPLLEGAVADGRLFRERDKYRFAVPPGPAARRRWQRHLARSKARVTARWLKHVVTFDNWLPYIVRKVERRTGMKVELTPLERRIPLLFLWPRVVRVLLARPEREDRE
jgi:hypothetical protein